MLLVQISEDSLKFQLLEHSHQEVCSVIFDFHPEPYDNPSVCISVTDLKLLSELLGVPVEIKRVTDESVPGCYEDRIVVKRSDAIAALQNVDSNYGEILKRLESLDWKVSPVPPLAESPM